MPQKNKIVKKSLSKPKTTKITKSVPVYNMKGRKTGTIALPDIFYTEIKPHLVHKAMVQQQLNIKPSTANTKDRGERRGGGIKPWRQKGTGRARFGSSRNPIWRKGGVTFGPTPEKNFKIKINKKEKRQALFSLLSDKVKDKKIFILDKLQFPQIKTKQIVDLLANLNLIATALIIIPTKDEKIQKSAKNIPFVKALQTGNLNILDLLKYEYLIITKDAVKKISEIYQV